ncbi:hypothetical protein LTS17_009383 [Exophiala oligosperma]
MIAARPNSNSGHKRSRTGCMNCRRKKKKCDEGKPTCYNCVKTSEKCTWGRPLSFLPQNAFTINEDSTPANMCGLMDYHDGVGGGGSVSSDSQEPAVAGQGMHSQYLDLVSRSSPAGMPYGAASPELEASEPTAKRFISTISPVSSDFAPGRPSIRQDLAAATTTFTSLPPYAGGAHTTPEQGQSQMESCRSLRSLRFSFDAVDNAGQLTAPVEFSPAFELSPELLLDDGIFIPGSTYQELHSTLRHNMLSTARSKEASRQPSQERDAHGVQPVGHATTHTDSQARGQSQPNQSDPSEVEVVLSAEQEYRLWKNWVDEIAHWLDKFDRDRHFGQTLPVMAKTCAHLRYAMLALSARQLERKDKSIPAALTLSLYSAAVHLLLAQLHLRNTPVLASCVVICVLEMMSCSPKAWRRHLDGCACLIRSMHIYGDSEGIERALFWCFARMDVCGGLISKERTLIPVAEWTSEPSFDAAVKFFSSRPTVDWSACYASYLSASTIDLLFASTTYEDPRTPPGWSKHDPSFPQRWSRLFGVIEQWYENRPPEMLPLVTHSATSSQPFPTLLFGSGAATSGNQLHHAAAMLMLQYIPRHLKCPPSHSLLWHARRLLWMAGQFMSHPTEHQAIIDIYARIEKETGWGATWRADDLKQFWGEID